MLKQPTSGELQRKLDLHLLFITWQTPDQRHIARDWVAHVIVIHRKQLLTAFDAPDGEEVLFVRDAGMTEIEKRRVQAII